MIILATNFSCVYTNHHTLKIPLNILWNYDIVESSIFLHYIAPYIFPLDGGK